MKDLSHLQNSGIATIGIAPESGERTAIILGCGRGGTSLCSCVLTKLGIFMGRKNQPPTYEDIELSIALENRDFEAVESIVETYNTHHKLWGFKRPTTNHTLSEFHSIARRPVYIVIFRDILAIAERNRISMDGNLLETMNQSIQDYSHIHAFLSNHLPYSLLLSYEKVLKNPEKLVNRIIEFLDIENQVTENQKQEAINSIMPSPVDYIINASLIGHYGYLDNANIKEVTGWAAIDRSKKMVELDIFLNEKNIATIIPNQFRKDIKDKGIHPTGNCGYRYTFPKETGIENGDTLSIRFKDTGEELRGSPFVFEQP